MQKMWYKLRKYLEDFNKSYHTSLISSPSPIKDFSQNRLKLNIVNLVYCFIDLVFFLSIWILISVFYIFSLLSTCPGGKVPVPEIWGVWYSVLGWPKFKTDQ